MITPVPRTPLRRCCSTVKAISKNIPPSGLILLHKQPGITSFDALRDIKRAIGSGKAGHTGTLDKFAEGLMLVLTGRTLKLSKWFTHCDKQYEGMIRFGAETDTLDPEGVVIATASLSERDRVEQVLSQFKGEIEQTPPAYSAIHINGERASALARQGKSPEMHKRSVTIYSLELLSWKPPFAKIFVHCSSGTYIRSLARDIAIAAGSRGHLVSLLRTQVAGFRLNEAMNNEDLGEGKKNFLHPIDKRVFDKLGIPCIDISSEDARRVIHGKSLMHIIGSNPALAGVTSNTAALFLNDELIAVIEKNLTVTPNAAIAAPSWNYGYVYANS